LEHLQQTVAASGLAVASYGLGIQTHCHLAASLAQG
jgi:hypothetical protein